MTSFVQGHGREFFKDQLAYLANKDVEGLLENQYHKDAVMITFDSIRRGHEELRRGFENTLVSMGKITQLQVNYFAETEDTIIFKATITDDKRGTIKADNALYMKDGKIYRHIALTILPNFDYEKYGTAWKD
jgi:hypothetical protein